MPGKGTIGIEVPNQHPEIVALKEGRNYLKHLGPDFVKEMARSGRFEATANMGRLGEADAVISAVPTPLGPHLEPDMSYVMQTTYDIAKTLRKGQLVVLESTTYPRTTRDDMLPVLEKTGLKCGKDFFLAFSPERVDPGNPVYQTKNTPKVVGGITEDCSRVVTALYKPAIDTLVQVSTTEAAELVKLLENTFRSVNIGLVNEMAIVCDKLGVDVWEVIEAAATKPFGYMKFLPGPGLGGHCIPIDPHYLAWKMRGLNYKTRFIDLAGEVNTEMPAFWVTKVQDVLNGVGKPLHGSRVLVLGVAYKKDIDDLRESPALEILDQLNRKGAVVSYHDPFCPEIRDDGHTPLGAIGRSVELTDERVREADVLLIVTDHSNVNYERICGMARIVVDTRNACATARAKSKRARVNTSEPVTV